MNGWQAELLAMLGAFAFASAIAAVFGASFGHALTVGQLAFAATLVFVLVRR